MPAETAGREEVGCRGWLGWMDIVGRDGRVSQRDGIAGAVHQKYAIVGRVGEQSNTIVSMSEN